MRPREKRDPNLKVSLTNLSPLLSVLQAELGLDWEMYDEFLEGASAAIMTGRNPATWMNQIEPLIQSHASQAAHQGVLFLLRDVEWRHRQKRTMVTTSYPPSLHTNESSLSYPVKDTTAPQLPQSQPSMDTTTHSANESTLMLPVRSKPPTTPSPSPAPPPRTPTTMTNRKKKNTLHQANPTPN